MSDAAWISGAVRSAWRALARRRPGPPPLPSRRLANFIARTWRFLLLRQPSEERPPRRPVRHSGTHRFAARTCLRVHGPRLRPVAWSEVAVPEALDTPEFRARCEAIRSRAHGALTDPRRLAPVAATVAATGAVIAARVVRGDGAGKTGLSPPAEADFIAVFSRPDWPARR